MINDKEFKEKKEKGTYGEKGAFFQCGSRRLSHWLLTKKEIFPVDTYVHNNGKTISIFVMTPELSEALYEWTANNPNKKN